MDDEQKLAQLRNEIREPVSVVLWNLKKDGSTVTFDQACAALEKIYGSAFSREALKAQLACRRRKPGESTPELGIDIQKLMCLVYPGAGQSTTEELGMNAFFTALDDVELQTQCRMANPNSLQEAIQAAQRIESCRLAASVAAGTFKTIRLTSLSAKANDSGRTMVQQAIADCLKVKTPAAAPAPVAPVTQQAPASKFNKNRQRSRLPEKSTTGVDQAKDLQQQLAQLQQQLQSAFK